MQMEGKIIPKQKATISKEQFNRNNERKGNWQPSEKVEKLTLGKLTEKKK